MGQSLTVRRQSRLIGMIDARPIWALYGSDGEETKKTDPPESGKPEEKPTDPPEGTPATPPAITPEAYAALETKLRLSDQARTAALTKIKEFEDAGATEIEKLQKKTEEAEARAKAAEERARVAQIRVEILKTPGQSWHDPDAVLKLIDMTTIEVKEDGSVSGVKEAVQALAKAAPYLLKDDSEKKPEQKKVDGPPSGHQPSSGNGKPDDTQAVRDKLAVKYHLPV